MLVVCPPSAYLYIQERTALTSSIQDGREFSMLHSRWLGIQQDPFNMVENLASSIQYGYGQQAPVKVEAKASSIQSG